LFLDPDLDLCRAWLLEAGLDPHDAAVVLQDYYSPERVAASVAEATTGPVAPYATEL
jgi:hypothetical protein